jgi:dolichol kinase
VEPSRYVFESVEAELGAQAVWVHEQVREILQEADPSAWRADRAEALRQRVRSVVAALKRRSGDFGVPTAGSVSSLFPERLRNLGAVMERALPAESTRSRWAAFVGEVHPAYEALLASLSTTAAVPSIRPHRPTNYARSLLHFGSSAVGCAAVALFPSRSGPLWIAVAFFTYAWSMEALRRIDPRINARLMRFYGSVAHPHEHFRVNSATWFATALVLLAAFATRPGMMAGLAVLGVADPIAALVGRRWGKHMLRTGRSLEGTLAFFVSGMFAAVVALALVNTGSVGKVLALAALAAFAGALAELFTKKLDDNLTIPLVAGTVVSLAALGGF